MPHRVNDEKGKMTRDTLNINFKSCLIDDRCDKNCVKLGMQMFSCRRISCVLDAELPADPAEAVAVVGQQQQQLPHSCQQQQQQLLHTSQQQGESQGKLLFICLSVVNTVQPELGTRQHCRDHGT